MITIIGDVNVDYNLKLLHFPDYDEDAEVQKFSVTSGGVAANTAYTLRKLGTRVALVACVGKDENAKKALDPLAKVGVDLSGVCECEEGTGASFSVVDESGVRRLMTYRGANAFLTFDKLHLSLLKNSEWVHIGSADPFLAFEVIKHFKRVSWDPGWIVLNRMKIPSDIFEGLKILFVNSREWNCLKDMYGLLDFGITVIKNGSKGVEIRENGKLVFSLKAFKVKSVDSTGAGDVFNAAFLYSYIVLGRNLKEAVLFANAAAAISVTAIGAQGMVPTFEDVEKFIKKSKMNL